MAERDEVRLTDEDAREAAAAWRRDAPPQWRDLLDAEPIDAAEDEDEE